MKHYSHIVLVFIIVAVVTCFGTISRVQAQYRCSGKCHNCGPRPKAGYQRCDENDDDAEFGCCYDSSCNGDCEDQGGSDPGCGNCDYFCPRVTTPTPTPTPTVCVCTETQCPPDDWDKFKMRPTPEGTYESCLTTDSCSTVPKDCFKYKNTPPTCEILPTSIAMTRNDAPKQFALTITDNDYGDTVQITGARTVDSAGKLNSCVKITTLGGGDVFNLTVKTGSDDPANITQTTNLLVNSRGRHGVFENIGGNSLCQGLLQIEIRDVDSDGAGPDVADTALCEIPISVSNDPPHLENVQLLDMEKVQGKSPLTREGSNMIDGRGKLFVGSVLTLENKKQATLCKVPLMLGLTGASTNFTCPVNDEGYLDSFSRRRNPLQLEFTVSDANGSDDIMQAGMWIQRVDLNKNSAALPLINAGGSRNSFQAMYSEMENIQVNGTRWNFVSRACLGTMCGSQNIRLSSRQIFSALALINELPSYVSMNGNVKIDKYRWASQRKWQKVGFPDCLDSVVGCSDANVPDIAQTVAGSGTADPSNYDWAVATDSNHLICFLEDNPVPTKVDISGEIVCPGDCAACAKKEGVFNVAGNPNVLTFKFGIYFNDKDSGHGMQDGEYSIFLSALDKVSVPLNNVDVSQKGDNGWVKFDKNGNLCTGSTCPGNSDFVLLYDATAPQIGPYAQQTFADKTLLNETIGISDSGSGIGGVTKAFMARQGMLDGLPLENDLTWAYHKGTTTLFDGKNTRTALAVGTTSVKLEGGGFRAYDELTAGICAYDRAGNMSCGNSTIAGTPFTFLAPWLKTSYGDIYSVKENDTAPFGLTLPASNGVGLEDKTKDVYLPFTKQEFTIGTGYLLTANVAPGTGLMGGYFQGGANHPLGFTNNYRVSSDITGYIPSLPGNEYARLKAIANLNCELMNSVPMGSCANTGAGIGAIGVKDYNVVTLTTNILQTSPIILPLNCVHANVIFVEEDIVISREIVKTAPLNNSGCVFVVKNGKTLTIRDVPSDLREYPPNPGIPTLDRFDAAIIAEAGAAVIIDKGDKGATTQSTDRLGITGWIYSANESTAPKFLRNLAEVDNRRYPAEYIKYDVNLLDVLSPLLGFNKTADITCGTSGHVLCK